MDTNKIQGNSLKCVKISCCRYSPGPQVVFFHLFLFFQNPPKPQTTTNQQGGHLFAHNIADLKAGKTWLALNENAWQE